MLDIVCYNATTLIIAWSWSRSVVAAYCIVGDGVS